jgi:hypothetical protein
VAADALARAGRACGRRGRPAELPADDNGYETASLFVSGMAGGCSVVWLPADSFIAGTRRTSTPESCPGCCVLSIGLEGEQALFDDLRCRAVQR